MIRIRDIFVQLICIFLISFTLQLCRYRTGSIIQSAEDGTVLYSAGNLKMRVDPKHGARIVSFSVNDKEILYQGNQGQDNFGSTFLPSPQSFWVWPPPPIINSMPYEMVEKDESFRYISQKDTITGLIAIKELIPGKFGNFIDVKYFFVNTNDTAFSVAPWQNSRLMKGGLFFFESGENVKIRKLFNPLPLIQNQGYTWYKDPVGLPKDHRLSINDGQGWLAYLWNGLLLIQEFENIKPGEFAPGEGEIESYLSPEWPFIELECQGPYQMLEPGDSLSWHVRWHLLEVTQDVACIPGNLELIRLVESQINKYGATKELNQN